LLFVDLFIFFKYFQIEKNYCHKIHIYYITVGKFDRANNKFVDFVLQINYYYFILVWYLGGKISRRGDARIAASISTKFVQILILLASPWLLFKKLVRLFFRVSNKIAVSAEKCSKKSPFSYELEYNSRWIVFNKNLVQDFKFYYLIVYTLTFIYFVWFCYFLVKIWMQLIA
jgi:hypothetical protein